MSGVAMSYLKLKSDLVMPVLGNAMEESDSEQNDAGIIKYFVVV